MPRRLLALGAAATAAVALGACGGAKKTNSGSDVNQIVGIVKSYSVQPSKLCTTYATQHLIKSQFGSRAACLAAASSPKAKEPGLVINTTKVTGNNAAVVDTDTTPGAHNAKALVHFVRTSQGWQIDSIVPIH